MPDTGFVRIAPVRPPVQPGGDNDRRHHQYAEHDKGSPDGQDLRPPGHISGHPPCYARSNGPQLSTVARYSCQVRPRRSVNSVGPVTSKVSPCGISWTSAASSCRRSSALRPAVARSRCSYGNAAMAENVDTTVRVDHRAGQDTVRLGMSHDRASVSHSSRGLDVEAILPLRQLLPRPGAHDGRDAPADRPPGRGQARLWTRTQSTTMRATTGVDASVGPGRLPPTATFNNT